VKHITRRTESGNGGLILISEGAIGDDAFQYINVPWVGLNDVEKSVLEIWNQDSSRATYSKTRVAAVTAKILIAALKRRDKEALPLSNKVEYLDAALWVHSSRPSARDIVDCKTLGRRAVDAAVGGYTDVVIARWLGEWVIVPLGLVVMGERRFWKLESFCAQLLPRDA
jgi:6-phosphofructokinase